MNVESKFTAEETERLYKVLPIELNPFLHGEGCSFPVPLGVKTQDWLFTTHLNLPDDKKSELAHILSDDVDGDVRVASLSSLLSREQISSAPLWWELDFFEFSRADLWDFIAEQ